ncbi:MAG: uracil-DNA glycosylase [Nitrospirae bacterium]|nr:uracil-DNA glycosylase [Nitrospirota bacterium]
MNKSEAIKEIKKSLKFYQGLGFTHLPVHKTALEGLLDNILTDKKKKTGITDLRVSEKKAGYIADKQAVLKALRGEIGDCQRCKLAKGRKNIVFGEGNYDAKIMFIGEGPGREEDIQARPFVGDAGKLLTRLIEKMGFKREDVYIANIVKCRPPNNRDPEEDEIAACSPFLKQQVEIILPGVIMSLGRISAQTLTGSKIAISRLRGRSYDFNGIPLMPTFHPAYLLRNPKDKQLTWEDALKVLEKLKKP